MVEVIGWMDNLIKKIVRFLMYFFFVFLFLNVERKLNKYILVYELWVIF